MILRATTATLGLAAAAVMLSGCLAPAPEPTPTATAAFASEEEAFAAAEETYRAYVDAANARREDPESEPDSETFLVGHALENEIDARRDYEQLGIRVVGPSIVTQVQAVSADPESGDVVINACYDSSEARAVNQAGEDVTLADRDPTVMQRISTTVVEGKVLIEELATADGATC